jgi:adenylate kinase family enzyme
MPSFPFKRVVVVGTTSSGKSTLAKNLAEQFSLDFIELDALHWEPNWKEVRYEVFRRRVDIVTQAKRWVVAGNYHVVRDLIWPHAEAVIWLDYPLWTILWQLTRRTFSRWWKRELLWGSNYENLFSHFKIWSDDSLYHWLFKTYWRRKREFLLLFALPENAHLKIIRLRSPEETKEWIKTFSSKAGSSSFAEPDNQLSQSQGEDHDP